nr:zf-HC2 domain-containing protein [Streptomyces sp. SID5468]
MGVLDEADAERFERHLAVCGRCAARLEEFGALVPVLAELGQAGVPEPPDAGLPDRLLARVAQHRRAGRRRRWLTAVSAALLIVAGPTAAVLVAGEGAPPTAVSTAAVRHAATDPRTGVSAVVGVTGFPWGSRIDLRLSGVYGPLTCRLVVVGRDGGRETVANWRVPPAGYGTDDQRRSLEVSGATTMTPAGIARFTVVTDQGRELVSVAG